MNPEEDEVDLELDLELDFYRSEEDSDVDYLCQRRYQCSFSVGEVNDRFRGR